MKHLAITTAIIALVFALLPIITAVATDPEINLPSGCPNPSEFTKWELTYVLAMVYDRTKAEAAFDCYYKGPGDNPTYVNATFVRSWVSLERTWTHIFVARPSTLLPSKYDGKLYAYEEGKWQQILDQERIEVYKTGLRNMYLISFDETNYENS